MDEHNPYSSPLVSAISVAKEVEPTPIIRRRLALWVLFASVAGCLFYTLVDEVVLGTAIGAWPMLFASAGIAVFTSVLTRDWLVSPLCCFCGVMAGDILSGLVRDWAYAQIEIALPLAIGFSVPSLITAFALICIKKRQMMHYS